VDWQGATTSRLPRPAEDCDDVFGKGNDHRGVERGSIGGIAPKDVQMACVTPRGRLLGHADQLGGAALVENA
jgi:hypothetical protein